MDVAEIELSVFTRQYLNRRIPDLGTLRRGQLLGRSGAILIGNLPPRMHAPKLMRLYPQYKEKCLVLLGPDCIVPVRYIETRY